jgi:mono/diheme cytochrome c family protein
MRARSFLGCWLVAALGAGCFYSSTSPLPDDFGVCPSPAAESADAAAPASSEPGAATLAAAATYFRDIQPIVAQKCAGCHRPDDLAPFSLQTYDELLRHLPQVRGAVQSGTMPPWQPDPCCNHYRWDRSLEPGQRETLLSWIDAGAPLGDPADAATPAPPPTGLPRVDVRAAMPELFVPSPRVGVDEVRCFVLDAAFPEDTFVTGIQVIPGNRGVVHHVIVYAVSEDTARGLARRQGADGRPGWDCYGDISDVPAETAIGGWQPGYRPLVLPDGLGRRIHARSRLVMNIHYDTGQGTSADQTAVELMLAPQVDKVERGVAIVHPLWFAGEGMDIAAGDPDASVFFSYDPTVLFSKGKPLFVHALMLHMHELGSIGRLAIVRKNGEVECLLNITGWDFHWLSDYYLEEPVRLDPGDHLVLECHWDNTAGNQKVLAGGRQAPRTIGWGLDQEMCAATVSVTE